MIRFGDRVTDDRGRSGVVIGTHPAEPTGQLFEVAIEDAETTYLWQHEITLHVNDEVICPNCGAHIRARMSDEEE